MGAFHCHGGILLSWERFTASTKCLLWTEAELLEMSGRPNGTHVIEGNKLSAAG